MQYYSGIDFNPLHDDRMAVLFSLTVYKYQIWTRNAPL